MRKKMPQYFELIKSLEQAAELWEDLGYGVLADSVRRSGLATAKEGLGDLVAAELTDIDLKFSDELKAGFLAAKQVLGSKRRCCVEALAADYDTSKVLETMKDLALMSEVYEKETRCAIAYACEQLEVALEPYLEIQKGGEVF